MSIIIENANDLTNVELLVEKITRAKLPNVSSDSKIIIKPNICAPKSPETGVTTHHEIIKGVLNALNNCKNIIVVESDTTSSDFEVNIKGWNSDFLKDYPNVRLVNLSNEKKHIKLLKGINKSYEVEIAEILEEYDYLIDLPVLKTHIHAKTSIGIKNLFGLLSAKNKSLFHIDIHDLLIGILREFKPHLTIVDAIQGLEGQGPIFGTPAGAGIILAGKNVVEVDYVGTKLIGIDPYSIKYLNFAINEFNEKKDIEFDIAQNILHKKFNTYPTLIYQVSKALNSNEEVDLQSILDNIDVPQQTKNNLPTLLNSLIERKIVKHNKISNKYSFKNIDTLVELYPETKKIFV